jgi:selenocysteine-specific translation elongation factor
VKVEKRANKNIKIRLLFSETETAKQNQKFPFHFFVGSPHTPRRKSKIKEGKFLVFAPATEGNGRGAQNPSVRFSFKPPRAPRVRHHLFWK